MIDVDAGTDEAVWAAWPALAECPALAPPSRGPGVAVVVAPHPDDEVLGVGGTMRALQRAGWSLRLVAVTDGEASHPAIDDLAVVRRRESAAALERLGVRAAIDRLGVPDGAVTELEDDVARLVLPSLTEADLVLAPWIHDGHPDHDACGRAARCAAERAGVPIVEYLVWTWNWSHPGDERVPWGRRRRVDLDEADRRAKAAAIDAFASQIRPLGPPPDDGPILPAGILAHHRRAFEVLLV